MKQVSTFFILFFFSIFLNAQIINIEKKRMITDTTGWSGTIGLSVSANKFTKSFFSSNANGHLQYQDDKNLYLAFGVIDFVSAGGEEFNNSGVGHIRYNRKLTSLLRVEAFSQVQYNSITKIQSRFLNGAGIRLKLSQYEKAKFYYGLTYMYEYEELNSPEIINKDHRLSSYATFTLSPEDNVSFTSTTYMQPKFGDIRDYRLNSDINMVFHINRYLKMVTNFHYLYDSKPPEDIPSVNYEITNGLIFKFN
jgi:hypothetical protein